MIPFVLGALMLYNSAMAPAGAEAKTMAPQSQSVEQFVRQYYTDTPILAEVARCESQFRQYDKTGVVLRGEVTPADMGIMQINEHYHSDAADNLNLDITTIQGNLAYAKYLYEKEGLKPWKSSQKCWGAKDKEMKLAAKN